ncbi:predicted protein [Uncinocarpus reesii 1704]|uniref:Uncharacterized protein n=1 Tax=Uncinocarpus reesii (strain UAMH 1704) TaxID=336963 RepID=C4JRP7_UNCRE|nr:uncharacterized protein UREG_05136 [Uncinocarpus reesii 1704]EEP80294.1 predicted protein [Uncinocarpus reesii 1704]
MREVRGEFAADSGKKIRKLRSESFQIGFEQGDRFFRAAIVLGRIRTGRVVAKVKGDDGNKIS